jgi:DNA processing protein
MLDQTQTTDTAVQPVQRPAVLEWLILNSVNGLGPVRIARLLECFGSPEAILGQSADQLCQASGIGREIASRIRDHSLRDQAQQQCDAARRGGIEILTLADDRYPPTLREIFAPPPVIFVKGDLSVFSRHAVAIVGTRKPTAYGRSAAAALARDLAPRNVVVVSGLAMGIDTVAHQACLDNGGKTVAVLGCGVDMVYPVVNTSLAERIVANGALVSEFPLETSPLAHNFPRRNRIISGLSAGVLVVEAGQKSGSLITASFALQQGRDVLAVPGPIFSDKSVGTFNLIKSGATPVRTVDDIIETLQTVTQRSLSSPVGDAVAASLSLHGLSQREQDILSVLSDEPRRMDQISETGQTPVAELFDILLNLELKGLIRQVAGQQFVRAPV